MRLTYENERGKVVMHGGASEGFNITQIRGLSIPENDVATVRYPNLAGQSVTKSTPIERMITISADVKDDNKRYLEKAIAVFTLPGVMQISSFGKTKKINCRCVSFEPNNKKGSYIPITVQFCADFPYFTDMYETKTIIAKRGGCLASPFVLGCVFSERHTKNNVINHGDVKAEPVVDISSPLGSVCPNGITIKNLSNNQTITLNTDILPDEVITVDIKERKIMSDIRGNLISTLAEDTSLSRFWLDVGVSEIEVTAYGSDGKLVSFVRHNNSYVSVLI